MATEIAELFPLRTFVRVVRLTCGPYRGRVGIVREHNENEIGVHRRSEHPTGVVHRGGTTHRATTRPLG